MTFDPIFMGLTYAIVLSGVVLAYSDKIINQLKKSIKQYIEYTEDIPIKWSVGK